jgi:hypothetical protein
MNTISTIAAKARMTDADCSGLTEFLQDFLLVEVSYPILFLNIIAPLNCFYQSSESDTESQAPPVLPNDGEDAVMSAPASENARKTTSATKVSQGGPVCSFNPHLTFLIFSSPLFPVSRPRSPLSQTKQTSLPIPSFRLQQLLLASVATDRGNLLPL